jgi:hypothetical protein
MKERKRWMLVWSRGQMEEVVLGGVWDPRGVVGDPKPDPRLQSKTKKNKNKS